MKKVLVINAGSTSLKFKIYSIDLKEEVSGIVERIGLDKSLLSIKEIASNNLILQKFPAGISSHKEALLQISRRIKAYIPDISLVGHRVVHGGEDFTKTTRLTEKVIERVEQYSQLAPLHNPVNLACIYETLKLVPAAKQYAIFDTAYYKTIPDYAYLYALPLEYYEKYGIRRYGFHGTSHKYAVGEAVKKSKLKLKRSKIISCHLGGGSSITATKNGEAVDTSMGFTPMEGLTMTTRSGDLDPSVPLYLIKNLKLSPTEVDDILNKKSGLLGISGLTDMREILHAAGQKVTGYKVTRKFSKKERDLSSLALKMFVYDIVRYIGQYATIMKGVDMIVFTGGIGEHSPVIRRLILKDIKHLGKIKSVVIAANEELMIAREAMSV